LKRKRFTEEQIITILKALEVGRPAAWRYGYPTPHDMLRLEGLVRNPNRTYRIYSEEA